MRDALIHISITKIICKHAGRGTGIYDVQMNTAKLMTKTAKNMPGLQKLMGTWSLTKLTNMHLNYSFSRRSS